MDRIRVDDVGNIYLVDSTFFKKTRVLYLGTFSKTRPEIKWEVLTKKDKKRLTLNDYDDITAHLLFWVSSSKYGGGLDD